VELTGLPLLSTSCSTESTTVAIETTASETVLVICDAMTPTTDRKAQLITASTAFFEALARKDFASVPWADSVVLRAPLVSGGADVPLIVRDAVRTFFNALGPNLGEVRIVGHFVNEDLTAIITKAEVGVLQPACVLRVADLFEVDAEGQITARKTPRSPAGSPMKIFNDVSRHGRTVLVHV
jgi:hypothetical protein